MENGFDDYSLVFEPVDFYYDGVNQTKRYLDVTKDGVATVKQTPDPIWGAETDANHTAAIDRTPIVRVKLVAPGEDNGNVVKTAIIKIHIVRNAVVAPEINITETKDVTLKHINQVLDLLIIFIQCPQFTIHRKCTIQCHIELCRNHLGDTVHKRIR